MKTKLHWIIPFLVMVFLFFSKNVVFAEKLSYQLVKITESFIHDSKNTITIPSNAIKVASNIFYLGSAKENGKIVEGYAFIHYKKNKESKESETKFKTELCEFLENENNFLQDYKNNARNNAKIINCYGFLAKGAKWKNVEPWIMNSSNDEDLNKEELFNIQKSALEKWEDAADGLIGDGNTIQIFGDGELTNEYLNADTESPDGKNEIYFGKISDSRAIAITIIWGIFGGPLNQRELIEWDQVYNQADFDWSTTEEVGKMDFDNIATHEDGHSAGLDDLYEKSCSEQTMYGYTDYGEIKKRTLETGDIAGISKLY